MMLNLLRIRKLPEGGQAGAEPGLRATCVSPNSVAEEGARLRENLLLKWSPAVVGSEDS